MATASVRPPAVAGLFYEAAAPALRRDVESCLGPMPEKGGRPLEAVIAPHAGYVYSGPVAGSIFRLLAPQRRSIRRVVLLGPAHRVPVAGLALPADDLFATPLGNVSIDRAAMAEISTLPQVTVSRAAHAGEHSLEVELPFLQIVLEEFSLVPLVVGRAGPEAVAEVLARLGGGAETLVGEQRGVDAVGQLAQLLDRPGQLGTHRLDRLGLRSVQLGRHQADETIGGQTQCDGPQGQGIEGDAEKRSGQHPWDRKQHCEERTQTEHYDQAMALHLLHLVNQA